MALMEGIKGCGGCHKLRLKTEDNIQDLKKKGAGFGVASCDARHTYIIAFLLKKPENLRRARPVICKKALMLSRLPWDSLAIRMPMSGVGQWAATRTTILQALGEVLDL